MFISIKKFLIWILIGIALLSTKTTVEEKPLTKEENIIGRVIIPKINLNRPLYKIDSEENTIEKNIMILKESIMPDKKNSILLLAAHSGTGNIAYFEELDKLKINDLITIKYQEKEYIYVVKEIWEEKKNGYINVNKENKKQLVLTTCSPKKENTQLIINCTIKES